MRCVVNIYRNDIIQITCNLYLNRFIPQRNLIRWLVLLFFFSLVEKFALFEFSQRIFRVCVRFLQWRKWFDRSFRAKSKHIYSSRRSNCLWKNLHRCLLFKMLFFFNDDKKSRFANSVTLLDLVDEILYNTRVVYSENYLYNFSKIFFLIIPNTYSWIQSQKNNLNDVFMNWKFSH